VRTRAKPPRPDAYLAAFTAYVTVDRPSVPPALADRRGGRAPGLRDRQLAATRRHYVLAMTCSSGRHRRDRGPDVVGHALQRAAATEIARTLNGGA